MRQFHFFVRERAVCLPPARLSHPDTRLAVGDAFPPAYCPHFRHRACAGPDASICVYLMGGRAAGGATFSRPTNGSVLVFLSACKRAGESLPPLLRVPRHALAPHPPHHHAQSWPKGQVRLFRRTRLQSGVGRAGRGVESQAYPLRSLKPLSPFRPPPPTHPLPAPAALPRPPPPCPWARTSRRPSWWPASPPPSSRASP